MTGRRTPLYPRHVGAGARMVDFSGWNMPLQYTSVREEQEAVRASAGVFDVSHMGRYDVLGPGAGDFLQRTVTNDISRVAPDHGQYNLMCGPDGGIVDDLIVYHRFDSDWHVVVNAGNREKDLAWLRDLAPAGVEIVDRSDELGLIAFQGPKAAELLPAEGVDLESVPSFGAARGAVAGVPTLFSRTGYTGEDGFELFVPAESAPEVWDALVAAGGSPCGLAARDVCRLEAGLRLYGNDMDDATNPYEAGLGWTVKLRKGEFVGSEALARVRADGPARQLVGLAGLDRTIPRHGAVVRKDGREVGVVTSGTYSFWLRQGIAMASVQAPAPSPGSEVEVDARTGAGRAQVVALPFYRGSVRPMAHAKT